MARIKPIDEKLSLYSSKQVAESDLFVKPYEMYSRNIKLYIEPLMRAVPRSYAYEVSQFHVQDYANNAKAMFTWRYDGSPQYCTQYWGDGIYYVSGRLEDCTWVQLCFDDHNWTVEEGDDVGDIMCQEFLKLVKEEEKYRHTISGDIHRLGKRIEKWTRDELLNERLELMEERKKIVKRISTAGSSLGVNFWENALVRVEEKLLANKQWLWTKHCMEKLF